MKCLVLLFTVIALISACKKTAKEELLQSNGVAASSIHEAAGPTGIAADIQPAAYTWRQLAAPSDISNTYGQNKIIQVNDETYCFIDPVNADRKVYKFNITTKRWGRSNDAFAERSNYHYWFSYQTKI